MANTMIGELQRPLKHMRRGVNEACSKYLAANVIKGDVVALTGIEPVFEP